jgi:hypothetical protein
MAKKNEPVTTGTAICEYDANGETIKLSPSIIISQIIDGTSILEFGHHKLFPLYIRILLRTIGVARPIRPLKLSEQEVLGIGVTHVEATLIDFGVVGTTGTGAILIVGN